MVVDATKPVEIFESKWYRVSLHAVSIHCAAEQSKVHSGVSPCREVGYSIHVDPKCSK
jgi:hypothetical protein